MDLAHGRIVGLLPLFAEIVAEDTHPMHFLLPGPHARRFRTRRAAGYALQPVIGRTRQFDSLLCYMCDTLERSTRLYFRESLLANKNIYI